jgi:hypothetical protein
MAAIQGSTHIGVGRIALLFGALAALLTTYAILAGKHERTQGPASSDGWDLGT